MPGSPSLRWYARPVLFVSDMDRSIAFLGLIHSRGRFAYAAISSMGVR